MVPVREEQNPEDDRGWRMVLTGWTAASQRDLSDWRELSREAYAAYTSKPLACAVTELRTNFVLGGGAKVVAADSRVQRVVERFWQDPQIHPVCQLHSIEIANASRYPGSRASRAGKQGTDGFAIVNAPDSLGQQWRNRQDGHVREPF